MEECPVHSRTDEKYQSPLFMIESSGKATLNARQACAVESAALKSGLDVVLILTSAYLDVRENTTCQLYMRIPNLKIRTVDIPTFAKGSKIGMNGRSKRKCITSCG